MRKSLTITFTAFVAVQASADVMSALQRAKAKDFDASDRVNCAQEVGQDFGTCTAGVARVAPGNAAVVVTFPNGFSRILTFENRQFLRGNATMSGVGTDTDWQLAAGTYSIRVDDQRFELPEALVFGN